VKIICRLIKRSDEANSALLDPVANGFGDLFSPEQIFHIFGEEGTVFCPAGVTNLFFNLFYLIEIKPSNLPNRNVYPFIATAESIRNPIKVEDPRKKFIKSIQENSSKKADIRSEFYAQREEEWLRLSELMRSKSNILINSLPDKEVRQLLRFQIDQSLTELTSENKLNYLNIGANGIIANQLGIPTLDYFFPIDQASSKNQIIAKILDGSAASKKILDRISALDTVVLWELNYLECHVFEALDFICRITRNVPTFYGGVRVIGICSYFEACPEKSINNATNSKQLRQPHNERAVSLVSLSGDGSGAQETFKIVVNARNEHVLVKEQAATSIFASPNWDDGNFKSISLGMFHSENIIFSELLDEFSHPLNKALEDLKESALEEKLVFDQGIEIVATHKEALKINHERVALLSTPAFYFWTKYITEPLDSVGGKNQPGLKAIEFEDFCFPIESMIQLKVGCKVMFTADDPSDLRRYSKGDLAIILDINGKNGEIKVNKLAMKDAALHPHEKAEPLDSEFFISTYQFVETGWKESESHNPAVRKATNFPVTLGYAVSIAKSYGMKFERIRIQADGFAKKSELVTALSRAKNFDHIIFVKKRTKLSRGA